MSLLKFLGLGSQENSPAASGSSSDVGSLRKIARELEEIEPNRARFIAAFAYLLGRVAHADSKISQEETLEMERIVQEKTKLPEEQAVLVVEIAKRQNHLFGHVENFLVTRELVDLVSREEKLQLLHCLFAVCSTDESVSTLEDREIRQIASELRLDHRDFISVRSSYRDYLDVLKKPEDEENS